MDKQEEKIPKGSSMNGKDEQLSILDTNTQKSPLKKKFCNTVFATKMRNRKKEEKLKEINSSEVLTNCKGMSIDVTRINSEAVPKLINAVEQKRRKRKRTCRWKLGMMNIKRKKTTVKSAQVDSVNKSQMSDRSVGETNNFQTNSLLKEEIKEENNLESIENFSCRRTEPFVGKLKTKEARVLNINKILNNIGDVSQNSNESAKNENNGLLEKNEKKKTNSVLHVNSSVMENKDQKKKELKNSIEAKSSRKKENGSNKYKKIENSNAGIADTKKELVSQESKNSSNKVNETKENVAEETSCQRTIPFEGKIIKKTPASVSAKSTDLACLGNANIKLDSATENVNTKPSCSIDSNAKQNSPNVISKKSKASRDVKTKSNSDLANSNANLKSSEHTDMINTESKSESSQIENDVKINNSIDDMNTVPDSLNKTNLKVHNVEDTSLSNKTEKSLNSLNQIKIKNDVPHNLSIETDNSTGNTDSQSTELKNTNSENNDWSCSRTEPFKLYFHCSRTLPYVYSKNKAKKAVNCLITDESITNGLLLTERDKSNDKVNIPRNSESEFIDCTVSSTSMNSDDNTETLVQNGEWKFKRKRQQTNSEEENKIEEQSHLSKKSKTKSSPTKTPVDKKLTATSTSPDKRGAYVLLTRLESMNDPTVAVYLKKTDLSRRVDTGLPSDSENSEKPSISSDHAIPNENKMEEVTKDASASFSVPVIPDANGNTTVLTNTMKPYDMNSPTEAVTSKNERLLRPKSRARRRSSSSMSSESPSITRTKRNKHPVNYVEDFTDSDDEQPNYSISLRTRSQSRGTLSFERNRLKLDEEKDENDIKYDSDNDKTDYSISLRTRSQSRGPSLLERNKSKLDEEDNENDMEVEEFSHDGQKSMPQSRIEHESNINILNQESTGAITRSLSRVAKAAESSFKKVQSSAFDSNNKKSFSVHQSELSATLSSIHNELNKQSQVQEDAELDKEIEEHSRNYERLNSRSKSPDINSVNSSNYGSFHQLSEESQVDGLRTPLIAQSSGEKQFATPKRNSKNNTLTPGSRASRSVSRTPRNISITPSRSGRESSCSVRSLTKSLPTKITRSRSNSENAQSIIKPVTKVVPTQDLKVQLIKLETVCPSFQDYSASEIEVLTRKYIDLLMNSNFTCDTWRTPINYHRPADINTQQLHQLEQVDNSDCVSSDVETQREDIDDSASVEKARKAVDPSCENHTIIVERIFIETPTEITSNKQKETSPNKIKEATHKKVDQQNIISQTPIESVIATLLDRVEPLEKRDFGILQLTVPDGEKNKEQVAMQPNGNEVSRVQIMPTKKDASKKHNSNTISVNGTIMYTCSLCNKIFVIEDLLKEHISLVHNEELGSTISISTTKSNEKQTTEAAGGSSASKITPEKGKKRYKYSDSLRCAICLQMFKTKELLFTHIMRHNEVELQEAYKAAMAMKGQNQDLSQISADGSSVDPDANNKKKNKGSRKKSTGSSTASCRSSVDGEESNVNDLRATSTSIAVDTPIQQEQQVIDLADNDVNGETETVRENVCQRPISICSCHAHETTNQDLQIEMVLLCKTCNVIFRRRDCFEVHYRSSPECRLKRTNNEITKVPKLFCSGCPCVLESLMKMREHLEEHAKKNNQGTVTFICNICKVAFFGVGGIFYSHWFNHTKAPNFVASRYSFPKLSVVTVLEDPNSAITTTKTQEGFFYIAEHVCRQCRLPFSSEPELQRHKERPCQPPMSGTGRSDGIDSNRLQMIKLICDLCKKYYVNKENFDRHCCERNHLKTPPPKFSRLPINSNEQAFVCGLCRAVAKSNEEMKEHWKRIHSPIMELYTCKTCNVVPSNDVTNYTYEKFEKHCRISHKSEVITCLVYFVTARYVCNVCKFGFESERSMKEHQVIHQKRSTVANTAPGPQTVPPISTVTPVNPPMPSFWVTNQPGADGGMQMHPVYLQYSNANANIHPQVPITSNAVNMMNTQQVQVQNTLVHAGTLNVTPNIITSENMTADANVIPTTSSSDTDGNPVLRTILTQSATNQPQVSAPSNRTIETIQIDSRSNSPISDTAIPTVIATASNSTENSVTADKTVSNPAALRKKSYMTMVNPDFESMLGTNKNPHTNEINNASSAPNNNVTTSSGNTTPASTESATPQPFEVVLVTDDLSENSNSESSITKDQLVNQQQNSTEPSENSSAKPFLRVRSIAELQKIQIHLCSVCGLSFDTPSAFEQHSRLHETANEVGRATPVQMISPMVSQTNKETVTDPHEKVLQQMREKLVSLTTNRLSPNNSDSITTEQQQQQNYWFASSNNTGVNTNASMNNTYNANQQQQQSQQQNARRRSVNSPVNTLDSYLVMTPRSLPPPYPGTTNTVTPSRPGTIQLPERNLMDSNSPGSKRPSGAATRIPQQSLPSFEELTGNRQANSRASYNCNPTEDSAQNHPILSNRLQMNTTTTPPMMQHVQPVHKTYSRNSNEMNYSGPTVNNPLSSYQNPVHMRKPIYTCKVYGCNYRSLSLPLLQSHEILHSSASKQTSGSSSHQEINLQPQESQRHSSKHVSVIQMPERTRHAVPSQSNADKRLICRICNFSCNTSSELIQHVTNNHSAPAPTQVCCYVCDYCTTPLIFDSEDLLRKHMNVSHNHSCTLCNKRYPSKEDLMLHMDVHRRSA